MKLEHVSIQTWSDGGHQCAGCSSVAAVFKGWRRDESKPVLLVALAKWLPEKSWNSELTEIKALHLAVQALWQMIRDRTFATADAINILQDESSQTLY